MYYFSFNPHLINYQTIYKKELNGSLVETIAKKYHCIKQLGNTFMDDGGCVEEYLGKYLMEKGYKQIYV